MAQLVGALLILGLTTIWVGVAILTQWRDTPRIPSRELTKPADTILAEEVITVTRRRTVKATRHA